MEDFEQKLVLAEYLYGQFGADRFGEFREALNDADEGFEADNRSVFLERLTTELEPTDWLWKRIEGYDTNIAEYERQLTEHREQDIRLKYFQYLSLLFTEIYLDLYFNNREKLQTELGEYIERRRSELGTDDLYQLEEENLSKLAYWMATGSGKTLIMHANLWQFERYSDGSPDNVLLITPNEGLTEQHLEEFEASGIDAGRFGVSKDTNTEQEVSVLDIHKISDETGEKTYSVDTFEGDNLVFVDEGHKGAQGDIWIDYREQVIGENGFSFEYSATFGQALGAIENEQLQNRYVQSIIFDYSFRNFHVDGFGKEYEIQNLSDDDQEQWSRYLTANLLSFYEQKKYYAEHEAELEPFNLEDPLWIFVGQTVNAVSGRTITKNDKVSDVESVVRYLARVLDDRESIVEDIKAILSGTDFIDEKGRSLFENKFDYLEESSLEAAEMYDEILELVFGCAAGAELNVVRLKNAEGEIGLRVGRGDSYFGLISIGSAREFIKRIEENSPITTEEQEFKRSLFAELGDGGSEINVLIGAKKFTEGWDSYRVSSMGLMRVGRSEGSEIIQIFGRGIRLQGRNNSLKRSSHLDISPSELPEHIHLLERLNVFGIKADYIEEFEAQLKKEDIPTRFLERTTQTRVDEELVNSGLKVPRRNENADFVAERTLQLPVRESDAPVIDLYSRVQTLRSATDERSSREKNAVRSEALELDLVDWDQLLVDLVDYKERAGYSNLVLTADRLHEVVSEDYFTLYCPESRFEGMGPVEKKSDTDEIVRIILKSYVDDAFEATKADWEDRRREYETLSPDDDELNFELNFRVPDEESLTDTVDSIISSVNEGDSKYVREFERSLYEPLFIKTAIEDEDPDERLRAPAQSLNDDEKRLVDNLEHLCKSRQLSEEDIYLLRNPRNRGVGFEQGGYPDFILWVETETVQKILFLDPHGMVFEPEDITKSNKVRLSHRVNQLEANLDDEGVEMYSYVISVTDEATLRERFDSFDIDTYESNNVYLQNQGYLKRILRDAGVPLSG